MKKQLKALSIAIAAVGAIGAAQACTSFTLPASDSGYVYGRTLEFGMPLRSNLIVFPKGDKFVGTGPSGQQQSGIAWTAKYAVVGMNALDEPVVIDGMNDQGLAGGLLNAPGTAVFETVGENDAKRSISSHEMLTYALTNFATVDEAKEGFKSIRVNGSPLGSYKGTVKVHMTLHDHFGKSIVVEYLDGKLVITDNPTGVLTNDPPFSWHLANLGNYANLTPVESPALKLNSTNFAPPSSGSGLHGLPGDFLSSSRFVRAAMFASAAPKANAAGQVNTAWHILGSFDIPPGSINLPPTNPYGGGEGGFERTEWSAVANARDLVYYVKTFENPTIQSFDLKKVSNTVKGRTVIPLITEPREIELN